MIYIVCQTFIERRPVFNEPLRIFTAIRKVEATTKDNALAKFYADTLKLKYESRIEPIECFEFDKLRAI